MAAGAVSAVVLAGGLIFSAMSAANSSTPRGGEIHFIVQPSLSQQGSGTITITGAIGDYGTTSPGTSSGNKTFGTAMLSKGTFRVDLTAIGKKVNDAHPTPNLDTCSAEISETAPAAISDGTGLYRGVHGVVNITETFAFVVLRFTSGEKAGQCNFSDGAAPLSQMGTVYGSGHVAFS